MIICPNCPNCGSVTKPAPRFMSSYTDTATIGGALVVSAESQQQTFICPNCNHKVIYKNIRTYDKEKDNPATKSIVSDGKQRGCNKIKGE